MKILHYHRNIRLEKGGVVRFVLDLCAAMAERGHEVMLLSPDIFDAPAPWRERSPGLPRALRAPVPHGPLGRWNALDRSDVEKIVRRAEVIHLHGAWMPTNVQAGRMAQRLAIPYVISPHGMLDDWCTSQSRFRKLVYHAAVGRHLFERAAAVHCTARAELDQARAWFSNPSAVVIPLLLDTRPYAALPAPDEARAAFSPLLEGAPTVLFLSRLHPKKRPETLIDAVGLLKQRGVACNLVIAGAGEPDYLVALERRAADRAVLDRTRFTGMVSGTLKASVLAMADVFALPTSQENFGLAVAEAMASGLPVVTTRGVDIWPELAGAGALVVPPEADAFAAAIATLLADPALRSAMSARARAWAAETLDMGRVAASYEHLYAEALARGKAAAA